MLILGLLLQISGQCVEVAGDRILAGDLAAAAPAFQRLDPATPLGYSPVAGIVRWLSRKEMAAAFGDGGEALDLPSRLCVVRRHSIPDELALLSAMRKALPHDADVSIVRRPEAPVPEGEYVFAPGGIRASGSPGVYQWRGRVQPAGGGRSVALSVMVRIRIQRPVLIAKRSLPAGSSIAEGDLAAEVREVGWPPPAPPENPQDYIGWRTRRPVEAGDRVDPHWLVAPLAAKAGSPVSLRVEQDGARVRMEALALTGGRPGDTVFVKSPFTAARIRARLTGPGEAVLAAEEPRRR